MPTYIRTYSNPDMSNSGNDKGIRDLEKSISEKEKEREWKNHKWIARKRNKQGKWIYDYGDGFPDDNTKLKNQHTGGYTDKYSENTVGRALKTINDIAAPIDKHEIYNDNAVGRVARLSDDIINVGSAFINDMKKFKLF